MNKMDQLTNSLISFFECLSYNNYSFLVGRTDALSRFYVLLIKKLERLNEPWQYQINFTSEDKQILMTSMLTQISSLSFQLNQSSLQITQTSLIDPVAKIRKLYRIITELSLVSINENELSYRAKIKSQIVLLANHSLNTIII
ncbi:hypothetical protein [Gilliamella apicola]|uniref:hypothetical protein n=1 Tax=Gilliamella apicola TaxID=1196095 RepID=UPI002FEE29FB